MSDAIIKVLADGRYLGRGVSTIGSGRFVVTQNAADKTVYRIDFSRWLGTAALSSRTITANGANASSSLASPNVDLTLSAATAGGQVTVAVLADDAREKTITIFVSPPGSAPSDYGLIP